MRYRKALRSWVLVLLLSLLPVVGMAQNDGTPDYNLWADTVARVDRIVEADRTDTASLEKLRAEVVGYREQFSTAQGQNKALISRITSQISALGPPPKEGVTEADEVAQRRADLQKDLDNAAAPGVRANEAFAEADGLVGEIDRTLRNRQAKQILTRFPTPLNPLNWVTPFADVKRIVTEVPKEILTFVKADENRPNLLSSLPSAVIALLAGALLLFRSRKWAERFDQKIDSIVSGPARRLMHLASIALQLALPWAGLVLLLAAPQLSGVVGNLGSSVMLSTGVAGVSLIFGTWLIRRLFPKSKAEVSPFRLDPTKNTYARWLSGVLVICLSLNKALTVLASDAGFNEATESYLDFVLLVITAYTLFLLARVFVLHWRDSDGSATDSRFLDSVVRVLARIAMVISVAGPMAGIAGYLSMAERLVMPAAATFLLLGLLLLAQRAVAEFFRMLSGESEDGLMPTLINSVLVLGSLPLLALTWGARPTDLGELWTKFLEGFSMGGVRVSPVVFVSFLILFSIGYGVTRLIQAALKNTILPKTKLDLGARTAIHSGVGYIGVFLAAIVAITTAGIDLSSLAILASALAVGIGFGLQTIVQNFVSGIILLVERPVSEGDWIEVGGQMGYVRRISVRATRIETFDKTDVIIPNADLVSGMVTNWTRGNLIGRLIVRVGVAYGTDTRKVERILREIANAQPLVVISPPPSILFMGFGADTMDFEARVILRDINFSLSVKSDMNHEIARRFAEEGIVIPFGQRDIWLRNAEALTGLVQTVPMAPTLEPKPEPVARAKDEPDVDSGSDVGGGDDPR